MASENKKDGSLARQLSSQLSSQKIKEKETSKGPEATTQSGDSQSKRTVKNSHTCAVLYFTVLCS